MCGKRAVSRSEFFPLIFLALSDRKIVGTEFFAARAWELNWRTNLIFKVSDYRVEVSAERENGKNHVIEA